MDSPVTPTTTMSPLARLRQMRSSSSLKWPSSSKALSSIPERSHSSCSTPATPTIEIRKASLEGDVAIAFAASAPTSALLSPSSLLKRREARNNAQSKGFGRQSLVLPLDSPSRRRAEHAADEYVSFLDLEDEDEEVDRDDDDANDEWTLSSAASSTELFTPPPEARHHDTSIRIEDSDLFSPEVEEMLDDINIHFRFGDESLYEPSTPVKPSTSPSIASFPESPKSTMHRTTALSLALEEEGRVGNRRASVYDYFIDGSSFSPTLDMFPSPPSTPISPHAHFPIREGSVSPPARPNRSPKRFSASSSITPSRKSSAMSLSSRYNQAELYRVGTPPLTESYRFHENRGLNV